MRTLYPRRTWKLNPAQATIYLSFDDGPHPVATPFVLEQLRQFGARATFFCLGKNTCTHPDLFQEIFINQHALGNHTQNHLNGWKTPDEEYLADILEARNQIRSSLFRPPYGRITSSQVRLIRERMPGTRIIMWDILSGDFDPTLEPKRCLEQVVFKSRSGSIIVFHDSQKAWDRLSYALPRVLEFFSKKGYRLEALPEIIA